MDMLKDERFDFTILENDMEYVYDGYIERNLGDKLNWEDDAVEFGITWWLLKLKIYFMGNKNKDFGKLLANLLYENGINYCNQKDGNSTCKL